MPRRALLRRPDRRRRDHGQRLPGAGVDRRPPPPRPVRRCRPQRIGAWKRYKTAVDDGLLKVMSKMGISVISLLSRRLQLRSGRPVAHAGRRVLPGMPSRISGIGLTGIQRKVVGAAPSGLERGRGHPAGRRLLPLPARRRAARLGANLIHTLQTRWPATPTSPTRSYSEGVRQAAADLAARPARLPRPADHKPVPLWRRSSRSPRSASGFVTPGMSLGALGPEAHGTLNIAMNRIGAKSDSGEGGEDPARYQPRRQRRQRELGDQADRLGPLRRDRRVPQQVPRDRDQGGAGRQARRGRPAARLQGDRDDRQAAPLDAGRHADLAAAAPRHLLDRGPGAADLRPEADQPGRQGLRQAGLRAPASARSPPASPRPRPT